MISLDSLREYSRGSLWLLPTIAVALAMMMGLLVSQIDVGPNSPLAFQGTPDDARSVLIDITGTMVTVIALLLGLAVVALQLSSTQFSPRLLRNFLRDRPNQVVLSLFVGTFAYSAGGLFTVGVAGGQRVDEFPRFAVTVAIAMLFVSLALLVYFADHLAHSIQVDHIMRVVECSTLPVIRKLGPPGDLPTIPPSALAIPAPASGYVQAVHVEQLLAAATARRLNVRLRPRVGEHVVAGTTLAWIWDPSGRVPPESVDAVTAALAAGVRIGFERTLEQDPGLGLRQLVDPACKALSPAVNDPYTAIQAIEHLSVLFAAIAARPVGPLVVHDATGTITVAVPTMSFTHSLRVCVGLIRRYGASEPTVMEALLRLLWTVLTVCLDDPGRWAAIEHEAGLIVAAAERGTVEKADLARVHAEADALRGALVSRRAGALPSSADEKRVLAPPPQHEPRRHPGR
jgi:uncharacterized membrane protein